MAPPPSPDRLAERILIVRLSALGDVIRTLPLLGPLTARFPGATLDWLAEPAGACLLRSQSRVHEVIVFPRDTLAGSGRRPLAGSAALLRLARRLRATAYDLVLDAQGTYKSGLLTWLTRAPLRVGYARGAAREYLPGAATLKVQGPSAPQSRVLKALLLAAALGAETDGATATHPLDAAAAGEATRLWAAAGPRPRVLISPGASVRQAYKRWPAERFGAAARALGKRGVTVRLSWGPGEEEMAQQAAAGDRALVLPGLSLPLLAELLRQADLFIGNDSGPAHLAALVGTRVLSLYGPTDPRINAPWGQGHVQIEAPLTATEPRRRDPALMARIEVGPVVAAAAAALGMADPT